MTNTNSKNYFKNKNKLIIFFLFLYDSVSEVSSFSIGTDRGDEGLMATSK